MSQDRATLTSLLRIGILAALGVFAGCFGGDGPTAPTVVAQPRDVTLTLGGGTPLPTTVTLGVGVQGDGPLEYQWLRNGAAVQPQQGDGASSSTLVMRVDIGMGNALAGLEQLVGDYAVVVTGPGGTITSRVARVAGTPFGLQTSRPVVAAEGALAPDVDVLAALDWPGYPVATISWTRDGQPVEASQVAAGPGQSTLRVSASELRAGRVFAATVGNGVADANGALVQTARVTPYFVPAPTPCPVFVGPGSCWSGNEGPAVLHGTGAGRWWAASSYGRLLFSADGARTWTPILTGLAEDFTAVAEAMVLPLGPVPLVATAAGRILRRGDAGAWAVVTESPGLALHGIAMVGGQTGLAVGSRGLVLRTTDAGASWQRVREPAGNTSWRAVRFVSATRAVAVTSAVQERETSAAEIWLSDDAGTTWQRVHAVPVPAGFKADFEDITASAPGVLVAVGRYRPVEAEDPWPQLGALILISTDGGVSWTTPNITGELPSPDLRSVSFSDPSNGRAVGWDTVFRTMDGGRSWQQTLRPANAVGSCPFRIEGATSAPDGETVYRLKYFAGLTTSDLFVRQLDLAAMPCLNTR